MAIASLSSPVFFLRFSRCSYSPIPFTGRAPAPIPDAHYYFNGREANPNDQSTRRILISYRLSCRVPRKPRDSRAPDAPFRRFANRLSARVPRRRRLRLRVSSASFFRRSRDELRSRLVAARAINVADVLAICHREFPPRHGNAISLRAYLRSSVIGNSWRVEKPKKERETKEVGKFGSPGGTRR